MSYEKGVTMLPTISPRTAFEMLKNGEARLIDVRESSEYAENFIPDARLVPLSIAEFYPLKDADAQDKPLIFFCRSGNRTEKSSDLLKSLAGDIEAWQMEGGLSGWQKEGLPVRHGKASFPMFRQIQIGAGALVLLGILGSYVWHPMFWLSAFVGGGLIFAGVTGFCGLGLLLARMPWNR